MSDIEEAVVEMLSSSPAVVALIGIPPPMRVYHVLLAQNSKLPAVAYQLVSDISNVSHQGSSGLARARIQFSCWGDSKEQCRELSRVIRMGLTNLKGNFAGVQIHGGFKLTELADFVPDVGKRRRILDMAIWHDEEV